MKKESKAEELNTKRYENFKNTQNERSLGKTANKVGNAAIRAAEKTEKIAKDRPWLKKQAASFSINEIKREGKIKKGRKRIKEIESGNTFTKENLEELRKLKKDYHV